MAARPKTPQVPAQTARMVAVTFSQCGHTAMFAAGGKSTGPASCPRGCDMLRPQHRRGR